jgi:hypothetical protein
MAFRLEIRRFDWCCPNAAEAQGKEPRLRDRERADRNEERREGGSPSHGENAVDRSHPPVWRLIEEEHLQHCKVFDVHRATMASPLTGEPHPFFRIQSSAWVNVVALTAAEELVMVRQFRQGFPVASWIPVSRPRKQPVGSCSRRRAIARVASRISAR